MEPKCIFLNEVELDSPHMFSLNFKRLIAKTNTFFTKEKIFCNKLQSPVKIEIEIGKRNDYDIIVELSNFCRKIIAGNEKDIGSKEIALVRYYKYNKGFIKTISCYKI